MGFVKKAVLSMHTLQKRRPKFHKSADLKLIEGLSPNLLKIKVYTDVQSVR
jgi:hypothetical protein